jgi:hypothetical protein
MLSVPDTAAAAEADAAAGELELADVVGLVVAMLVGLVVAMLVGLVVGDAVEPEHAATAMATNATANLVRDRRFFMAIPHSTLART